MGERHVGDFQASLGSERGPATVEGVVGALKAILHDKENIGSSMLRAFLLASDGYVAEVDEEELQQAVPTALVEEVESELGHLANQRSRARPKIEGVPSRGDVLRAREERELAGRCDLPIKGKGADDGGQSSSTDSSSGTDSDTSSDSSSSD